MVVHSKKKNHINCAQLAQLLEVKLFCVVDSTVVERLVIKLFHNESLNLKGIANDSLISF